MFITSSAPTARVARSQVRILPGSLRLSDVLETLRFHLAQHIPEWGENLWAWPHCNGQARCWMHYRDEPWCLCHCRWCRIARLVRQDGGPRRAPGVAERWWTYGRDEWYGPLLMRGGDEWGRYTLAVRLPGHRALIVPYQWCSDPACEECRDRCRVTGRLHFSWTGDQVNCDDCRPTAGGADRP